MELRISDLKKSYPGQWKRKKVPVLKGIDAVFQSGRLYVIKGISGSGKTTLLNVIGGIDKDYEGKISYSDNQLKRAAYVFQESLLLSDLTIRENLELIFPDSSRIDSLSEQLGVSELLSRRTEELSGGERQRIAVVRALLLDSPLILADEPTASLDGDNSKRVAKLISSLKETGRIVIVATHEHYFDEYADEVLYLKDGNIEKIEKTGQRIMEDSEKDFKELSESDSPKNKNRKNYLKGVLQNYRYIRKRRKGSFSLRTVFPIAFVFFLILIVSTVQKNLAPELIEEYRKLYPMDVIEIPTERLDELLAYPDVIPYYDYRIDDDNFGVYSLLPEEYSCFSLPGMIEYGSFPKEENEVLVSRMAAGCIETGNPQELIGKEIEIGGEYYRISGISGDILYSKLVNYRVKNAYYREPFHLKAVFLPYETVKEKGRVNKDNNFFMCVWPGVSSDEAKQKVVKDLRSNPYSKSKTLSRYYNEIQIIQDNADLYINYFYIVMILTFLSAGVFICSLIRVDLFYRRKELGYLQIFGMKKGRVIFMVFREYIIRILLSFGLSFVLFSPFWVIVSVWRGHIISPDFILCLVLEAVLFLIYLTTVMIGIISFLRKGPIELIGRY